MRRWAIACGSLLLAPALLWAECSPIERLWFSAASPGYPAKEFWAPRLFRLHACHAPVSVTVFPPPHCDAMPSFVPRGPYCPGSQPHFPLAAPVKP